jgi:hypothetical protein
MTIHFFISFLPHRSLIRLAVSWVRTAIKCSYVSYVNDVVALFAHLPVSVFSQFLKLGLIVALRADSLKLHLTVVSHHRHSLSIV